MLGGRPEHPRAECAGVHPQVRGGGRIAGEALSPNKHSECMRQERAFLARARVVCGVSGRGVWQVTDDIRISTAT